MKQCPVCKSQQQYYVRVCSCGYSFGPGQKEQQEGSGNFILTLCSVFSGLQVCGALAAGLVLLARKQYLLAAVLPPIVIVYSCGMLIVFGEVNALIARREKAEAEDATSK